MTNFVGGVCLVSDVTYEGMSLDKGGWKVGKMTYEPVFAL